MYGRYKWRRRLTIIMLILIIITVIYTDFKIKMSLMEIAESKAQIEETEVINKIINEQVVNHIEYTDIVTIHKDDKGKIVLIQPDTIMMNKIMSTTVMEIAHALKTMGERQIKIPMGALTGSRILSGYGPHMKVRIIPTGQVYVQFMNKFDQAGINQTRHLVYFKIDSKIKIAVPFINEEVKVSTTVPIAETIIVGEVPDTYVNFINDGELLSPLFTKNKD
ncbi:MAG: sporulation protein YunB [Syntrophomonadaceae bacterium]|nr:sporulation protein YunB [Syntrophomonadaceae bacterium]